MPNMILHNHKDTVSFIFKISSVSINKRKLNIRFILLGQMLSIR